MKIPSMVNLTADNSRNLDVNCTIGCADGTTSNASSGVATNGTNGATVAGLLHKQDTAHSPSGKGGDEPLINARKIDARLPLTSANLSPMHRRHTRGDVFVANLLTQPGETGVRVNSRICRFIG